MAMNAAGGDMNTCQLICKKSVHYMAYWFDFLFLMMYSDGNILNFALNAFAK